MLWGKIGVGVLLSVGTMTSADWATVLLTVLIFLGGWLLFSPVIAAGDSGSSRKTYQKQGVKYAVICDHDCEDRTGPLGERYD